MSDNLTACGHPAEDRQTYSGALCGACYCELLLRIPRIPGDLATLIREAGEAGKLRATAYGERVQESREKKLPIDERRLDAITEIREAIVVLANTSEPIVGKHPGDELPHLIETRSPAVSDLCTWFERNLWLIAAEPTAWHALHATIEAAKQGAKLSGSGRASRRAQRARCSLCLAKAVRIELIKIGTFISVCGGCGTSKPIRVSDILGAIDAHDGDSGSTRGRPLANDTLALSSRR